VVCLQGNHSHYQGNASLLSHIEWSATLTQHYCDYFFVSSWPSCYSLIDNCMQYTAPQGAHYSEVFFRFFPSISVTSCWTRTFRDIRDIIYSYVSLYAIFCMFFTDSTFSDEVFRLHTVFDQKTICVKILMCRIDKWRLLILYVISVKAPRCIRICCPLYPQSPLKWHPDWSLVVRACTDGY